VGKESRQINWMGNDGRRKKLDTGIDFRCYVLKTQQSRKFKILPCYATGQSVAQLVEAPRYQPEGSGFSS
jgi:hypothetical protein